MNRSLLTLAALASAFAGALALTSTASAQTFKAKKFGEANGWTINANMADDQYMNCGAVAPGATYAALESSTEGWTLTFASKAKGENAKGSLAIDGKAMNVTFDKFDEGKYGVFLKPAQVKALQAGKALIVKTSADEITLPIDGLTAVTKKVGECVKKNSQ